MVKIVGKDQNKLSARIREGKYNIPDFECGNREMLTALGSTRMKEAAEVRETPKVTSC